MTEQEISAVFERDGNRWVAKAIEMPWIIVSGEDFSEARDNFLAAVRDALNAQKVMEAEEEFMERIANPN